MNKFTKEELYEIERYADMLSNQASKSFQQASHEFMLAMANDLSDEVKKAHGKILNEWIRTLDMLKSIRDKCEKERLGDK